MKVATERLQVDSDMQDSWKVREQKGREPRTVYP